MKNKYSIEEVTMTAQEYLIKKEQEEIDKLFDQAVKDAREQELLQLAQTQSDNHFAFLVSKLCDYEDELSILEDLHFKATKSTDKTKTDVDKLKQDIKSCKTNYTKVYNEIQKILKENI